MKHKIAFTAALAAGVLVSLSATLLASNVTLPYSFTAGTPARASEMNANFAAVKTAIDDNNARLTVLESRVPAAGAVSVSMHGFTEFFGHSAEAAPPSCAMNRILNYLWFDNIGVSCMATAAVPLPQGATLQGLSCLVYDAAVGAQEDIYPISLNRMKLSDGSIETVFSTSATSDNSGLQTLSDNTAQVSAVVDNVNYAYFIIVGFELGASGGGNLRLHGCKVGYQS